MSAMEIAWAWVAAYLALGFLTAVLGFGYRRWMDGDWREIRSTLREEFWTFVLVIFGCWPFLWYGFAEAWAKGERNI